MTTPKKAVSPEVPDVEGSTVKRFVVKHGGAERALKRYIASFSDAEGKVGNELGMQAPSKSYRSLRILSELEAEVSDKLTKVRFKEPS